MSALSVQDPLDLVRLCLADQVRVKLRGDRELFGQLHGYDQHLNLVLSHVQERISTLQIDEETGEEEIKIQQRQHNMLFVRGDVVILIAPAK